MPWVCSICSTNNPDNAKVCFVCDAERVKIKPIKEPESKREATVRKAKPKKEKRSETRIRDTELTPPPAIPAVTELRKPSKRRGAKRETDSTSTRGAGMRSTPRTASSARARTDRERSTEREANFKESLINARTVIVFSTVLRR